MQDSLTYSYLPKSTLPDDISTGMKELFVAKQYEQQKKLADIDETKKAMSVAAQSWNIDQEGINKRVNDFQQKYADALKNNNAFTISKLPLSVQQELNKEKNLIEYDAAKSTEQKKGYDKLIETINANPNKYDTELSMINIRDGYLNKKINERNTDNFLIPSYTPKTALEHINEQVKGIDKKVTQGAAYETKIGGVSSWQHDKITQQLTDDGWDGAKQSMLGKIKVNKDITAERVAYANSKKDPSWLEKSNSDYLDEVYKPIFTAKNKETFNVAAPKDEVWTSTGSGFNNGKYGVSAQVAQTAVANTKPNASNAQYKAIIKDAPIVNLQMPDNTKITTSSKLNMKVWDGSDWIDSNTSGKLEVTSPQLVYQPKFGNNPEGFWLRGDVKVLTTDDKGTQKEIPMPSATYIGSDFTAIANQMGNIPIQNLNEEANRALDLYNAQHPEDIVTFRIKSSNVKPNVPKSGGTTKTYTKTSTVTGGKIR